MDKQSTKYAVIINSLLKDKKQRSSDEVNFLTSVDRHLLRGGRLSYKQIWVIDKINAGMEFKPKKKVSLITRWEPRPSMFNPSPGTIFYSGEAPPW